MGPELLESAAVVADRLRVPFVSLFVAVFLGCAGSPQPVTPFDRMGNGLAIDTAFQVKQPIVIKAFSFESVLPVGDYAPRFVDGHGVFYASPTGVIQRSSKGERTLPGGIHMASQPGHYYSFPSLYVDFGDGSFSKLPLPDEVTRESYGSQVVFLYKGQPVQ